MRFHGRFDYTDGPFHGHCLLALFSRKEDPEQVIVFLRQSPRAGRTVANAIEAIAVQVIVRFSLDPAQTRFIHHVPAEQRYFEVAFTFQPDPDGALEANNAQWHLCAARPHLRAPGTPSPQDKPQ